MPKTNVRKIKTRKIPDIKNAFKYFLAQDVETKKSRPKITYGEKLTFLFKTLLEFGWRNAEGVLIVPFEKVMVEPYFYYDASISPYEELPFLFRAVETDKDFYRKHNMLNYQPTFAFNRDHKYSSISEDLVFKDYTNDFLKEYLKDRLGVEYHDKNKSGDKTIQKIEVLEDKTELKAIVMFINGNYDKPIEFNRRKYFGLFYTLARDQEISYKKGFFDYFNSNPENPLRKKHGFKKSNILKKEYDYIKPNIPIVIRTQKLISQTKSKTSAK
ncbi:MAG: hypothetical protein WC822_02125 [Candidatus Paceibacterota bacterium]|jgi:hypothetical protein